MTVVVSWDEAGYLPPLICSMGRRPPSRPESLRQPLIVRKRGLLLPDRAVARPRCQRHEGHVVEADAAQAEAHPAAGAPPVAAAVDRNPGEPGAPARGHPTAPLGLVRLQENVLHHVIGLLRVAQEEATQALEPPVLGDRPGLSRPLSRPEGLPDHPHRRPAARVMEQSIKTAPCMLN
jgi:hypothetical protein